MDRRQGSSSDNNDDATAKKCFSQIQSRKFWAPLEPSSCRLCPSMDLIVLGMPQSLSQRGPPQMTPTLSLHRTVSWQKLATIESAGAADVEEEVTHPVTTTTTPTTHVCWSPDGRLLAVAGVNVELYDVEALASSNGQNGDALEIGRIMTWKPTSKQPQTILGLYWAHMGRPHASCKITEDEVEESISMSYGSRYLFRATTFLPPSAYHLDDNQNGEESANRNALKSVPSCRTPLSILCIATAENGILLLLHGRYHIMTLEETPLLAGPTTMICSSDLTHLLAHAEKSKVISLFSFPSLGKHRFYLQSISALYCAISANIEAIQQQCTETAASWKSSLKPLDQKLEALVRLLQNYGVTDHVKSVLLQFILVGHTTSSSTLSSALDQFFAGVQMNDQLLQRMERSVSSALANVEKTARQGLLSPARLLVYHVGELFGLARFASDLLPVKATQRLKECSEILLVCAEMMVTQLVEARFRIRDFCDWLRATGSQVKARGTATTSVQRENAKKRRVSQAVVQRMIGYLQSETTEAGSSLTEHLLSLPISAIFHENPPFVEFRPQTASANSGFSVPTHKSPTHKSPTLPLLTNRLIEDVNEVFEHPRQWLSSTITKSEIKLPATVTSQFDAGSLVRIHHRQGSDWGSSPSDTKGCFAPQVCGPTRNNYSFASRNWAIVATSSASSRNGNVINLFVVPLSNRDEIDDDDLDDNDPIAGDISFYLTTQINLPLSYIVKDMSFYGDDGKSSLSSGMDSGTGTEGRQALGLLVSRRVSEASDAGALAQELWILRYDDLLFEATPVIDIASEKISLYTALGNQGCKALLRPLPVGCDEIPDEPGIVFAKTRVIWQQESSTDSDDKCATLLLSGSRGIGGAITTIQAITSLELFDLEEDEEIEDDGEEEEEGDEGESKE